MPKCASCNADIFFGRTKKGTAMPIDQLPVADGNLVVDDDGGVRILTNDEKGTYTGPRYHSHFATCPCAPRHRRAWK